MLPSDASAEAPPLHELWHDRPLRHAREWLAARDEQTLRTQIAISEISAPTGQEERRASWMAERMRLLGLREVRRDTAGNVLANRPGHRQGGAPVVVCAHLDTVFPAQTALGVRRYGNRLVGPGIGDNGRGLAAMLAVAGALDGVRIRTERPIAFVATTGEEGVGDLRGAKHVFASAARDAHAVIVMDGAGDERVVHRALGSRRFRIRYAGIGGHSWTAYGVPNAVHAAAIAAAKLAALPVPASPRTTLSVGRIGGGIAVNAIPDSAWLEVDVRSFSAEVLHRLDQQVRAIAETARQEENARRAPGAPPLAMAIEVIGDRPSGETAAEHPLVLSALQATRLIGREPELALASTDANVPISRGIPAIAIGAGGRGGDAHTTSEWFDNVDGPLGLARALAIVVSAAGLAA